MIPYDNWKKNIILYLKLIGYPVSKTTL